jgi:glycosyltransferase involved in cell wall biosynthesis
MRGHSRVVMLTHDARIDRRIMLEASALRAAGWQVSVVAMPCDTDEADPAGVVRIPHGGGQRHQALLAAHAACRRLLPMNGSVMRWLKAFAWSWLADPETFFLRAFEPAIEGLQADVVLAHDLPMLPVGSWLADRCSAKLVYDSHELWCEQNFPRVWREAWRRVESRHVNRCDGVITVNESIAIELQRRYGLRGVQVITNATVDPPTEARSLRATCGVAAEARVLLYQGSLSAGRQLEACVRAMHRVVRTDVHLVTLGDGILRERLLRLAQKGPSRDRIHILPAVPQEQLLAWTASADAGLVPYVADCLNSHLCTPNKLYEFIAAGLPILSSDLPELRRVVHGQGFGMVAELTSPMRIAEAIESFFSDPERLVRWRDAVRERRHEFGWPVQAERFRRFMRRQLAGPGSGEMIG